MTGPRRFDAVDLEVEWNRLIGVVNEQAAALQRTSFTSIVREAGDLSAGVFDSRGFMVAQAVTGTPGHINSMALAVRHILAAHPVETLRPGDVLITNDAWMGTGHMSDVSVVKPIFHRDRLVAFSATTSHMPDIGGRVRAIEAREVFEEGLHIPLAKLVHAGRTDETLVQLVRANVRTPDMTMGDIWAQAGAKALMERRVRALLDDYALDGLEAFGDEIFGRSERAMRQAIRPLANLARAADTLDPNSNTPRLSETGPTEVAYAATAFNTMLDRIAQYLEERVQILAAISHDLQTPITRMKLRAEEIARATGGVLVQDGPAGPIVTDSPSTSRKTSVHFEPSRMTR